MEYFVKCSCHRSIHSVRMLGSTAIGQDSALDKLTDIFHNHFTINLPGYATNKLIVKSLPVLHFRVVIICNYLALVYANVKACRMAFTVGVGGGGLVYRLA